MNLKDFCFTEEWTLFLDRDGVISRRLPDEYVRNWDEFSFLEGVTKALKVLGSVFGRIIIVSNQQGVGKGLMTEQELQEIDRKMKLEIRNSGGRIDAAFYCTSLVSENDPDRKPGTGMALKAKAAFPEIDFTRSVMVGDSPSDMEFGKRLGMVTVFIDYDNVKNELGDFCFVSLRDFAVSLQD
jgi:D-glycero-D-manno-heptose 1,7-bisphosphate phosphatase